jgi:ATP-dependent RNA helicase DeaD
MLRMGFIDDVEKLLRATPKTRQVALFSATMPDAIQKVARTHLKDPFALQVETQALTVEHIQQFWMRVPDRYKLEALVRVLRGIEHDTTLVFARTRAGSYPP